jgi:hypothetical protein
MAAARIERRLAAILAADVVGYSSLMERDEAGTLERLKAHRREFVDPRPLSQRHELVGAKPRRGAGRLGAVGHRRPTALLDEGTPVPAL